MMNICVNYIFFFQAEDGIRDVAVTGVQTCALPISGVRPLLGVLERLALLDLFAARHGDLPGAVHSVPALLRTGAVAARSLARGVGVDLGRDLAQPPRDGRGGVGVGLVRGDGAAALPGAGRWGGRALARATGK